MVPLVAAIIIWQFYLNSDSGWLARILGTVGIDSPDWLRDATWVLSLIHI